MSGNCFNVSANLVFRSADYKLIHAIVERRSDGLKHIHSVVYNTKKNTIIDKSNNNDVEILKELWIALGNIEHYVIYDSNEVLEKMSTTMNWGPWDNDLIKKI